MACSARVAHACAHAHGPCMCTPTAYACRALTAPCACMLQDENEKTAEEKASGQKIHKVLVEGTGLRAVMGVKGLSGVSTKSTHIMEVGAG